MGKKGIVRVKQMGPKNPGGGAAANLMVNPMEALMQPPTDEPLVRMPVPPDRSYKVYWPLHETFSMNTTKFQCVYPSYLDGTKTVQQGRRLSKTLAVTPSPTVSDVSCALQVLQVRHVIQPYKGYSRDPSTLWDNPGRVLIDVSDSRLPTKGKLMKAVAAIIPTLPARIDRLNREAVERELQERQKSEYLASAAATTITTTATSTATTTKGGNNKKKGKHGKKK